MAVEPDGRVAKDQRVYRVTHDTFAGADHATVTSRAAGVVGAFVAARLAGRPAPSGCRQQLVARP